MFQILYKITYLVWHPDSCRSTFSEG